MKLEDIKPKELTNSDNFEKQISVQFGGFKKATYAILITIGILLPLSLLSQLYAWKIKIDIKDIMAISSFIIVFVTCFYHAQNLKLNTESNNAKLKLDFEKLQYDEHVKLQEKIEQNKARITIEHTNKIKFSYQICSMYIEPQFFEYVQKARKLLRENELLKQLEKINLKDTEALLSWELEFEKLEERKALAFVLNYFENVSIAIKENLADESFVKDNLKTVMCQYYQHFKNYIDFKQQHPDMKFRSASFYKNYEDLVIKWL